MKKKTFKQFLGSLGAVFVLGASAVPTQAYARASNKYASIVYDRNADSVLLAQNAEMRRHPASLTKMMTMALVFEALKEGRVTLDSPMTVSIKAQKQPPTKIGVMAGETITVRQALQAMSVKSANDVAMVVAEHFGGTEEAFVGMMNRKARDIGMQATTYRNPSGLPDNRQVTTALDQARLLEYLSEQYPEYFDYLSLKHFSYNGKRYETHNKLVLAGQATAGKTGYTLRSGFNIAVQMDNQDQSYIVVVMGGRKAKTRDAHALDLFSRVFGGRRDVPRAASLKSSQGMISIQPRLKPRLTITPESGPAAPDAPL